MPKHTKAEQAKKIKRPSPKMLGSGLARKAAEAAKKRRKEMDKMMKEMMK
jgi:hypothetical protein